MRSKEGEGNGVIRREGNAGEWRDNGERRRSIKKSIVT